MLSCTRNDMRKGFSHGQDHQSGRELALSPRGRGGGGLHGLGRQGMEAGDASPRLVGGASLRPRAFQRDGLSPRGDGLVPEAFRAPRGRGGDAGPRDLRRGLQKFRRLDQFELPREAALRVFDLHVRHHALRAARGERPRGAGRARADGGFALVHRQRDLPGRDPRALRSRVLRDRRDLRRDPGDFGRPEFRRPEYRI